MEPSNESPRLDALRGASHASAPPRSDSRTRCPPRLRRVVRHPAVTACKLADEVDKPSSSCSSSPGSSPEPAESDTEMAEGLKLIKRLERPRCAWNSARTPKRTRGVQELAKAASLESQGSSSSDGASTGIGGRSQASVSTRLNPLCNRLSGQVPRGQQERMIVCVSPVIPRTVSAPEISRAGSREFAGAGCFELLRQASSMSTEDQGASRPLRGCLRRRRAEDDAAPRHVSWCSVEKVIINVSPCATPPGPSSRRPGARLCRQCPAAFAPVPCANQYNLFSSLTREFQDAAAMGRRMSKTDAANEFAMLLSALSDDVGEVYQSDFEDVDDYQAEGCNSESDSDAQLESLDDENDINAANVCTLGWAPQKPSTKFSSINLGSTWRGPSRSRILRGNA